MPSYVLLGQPGSLSQAVVHTFWCWKHPALLFITGKIVLKCNQCLSSFTEDAESYYHHLITCFFWVLISVCVFSSLCGRWMFSIQREIVSSLKMEITSERKGHDYRKVMEDYEGSGSVQCPSLPLNDHGEMSWWPQFELKVWVPLQLYTHITEMLCRAFRF